MVLFGPRQVGKTTLACEIAAATPDSVYLRIENPRDAARLADPGRYLDLHAEPRSRVPPSTVLSSSMWAVAARRSPAGLAFGNARIASLHCSRDPVAAPGRTVASVS